MMVKPHPGTVGRPRRAGGPASPFRHEAGFTLVEIIVSILLIAILGVVTLGFLTNLIQTNQDASGQNDVVDEVNTALQYMARELRNVDEFSWPMHCGNPAAACVVNTVYTRIEFSKDVEVPVDPARRDPNVDDIVYNLNGTNLERTSGGITTTLASGVSGFSIQEIDSAGAPGVPTGIIEVTLAVTRPSPDPAVSFSFTGTTAVRIRNSLPVLNIAFVVDDPDNLHGEREVDYNNHLQNVLGHNVSLFNDDDHSWSPGNFDAVVLSGDGGGSDDDWLANAAAPILTLYSQDYDEFELGTNRDTNGEESAGTVQVANHFITKVFGLGSFAFDDGGVNTPDKGYITGFANDVTCLVSYALGSRAKLLVAPSGGLLADGSTTAPARRAFLGMREYRESGNVLNRNGLKLFNRTLAWVAGLG